MASKGASVWWLRPQGLLLALEREECLSSAGWQLMAEPESRRHSLSDVSELVGWLVEGTE